MASHNNLKLFYLLPCGCHLAPLPSPGPDSSGSTSTSQSSARPAQAPTQSSRSSLRPALGLSPLLGHDDTDSQEHDHSMESNSPIQLDLSPTLAPSAHADPQVEKICDSTDYPSICIATVSPNLKGETDIPAVLEVAIQATAQYTKHGLTTAQKLAKDPKNSPQLTAVLNQCSDRFGKAIKSYGKASDAIPKHDRGTLNTTLIAIVAFAADCRDANSQDSKLFSISERLIRMTINCLAISSLMD